MFRLRSKLLAVTAAAGVFAVMALAIPADANAGHRHGPSFHRGGVQVRVHAPPRHHVHYGHRHHVHRHHGHRHHYHHGHHVRRAPVYRVYPAPVYGGYGYFHVGPRLSIGIGF